MSCVQLPVCPLIHTSTFGKTHIGIFELPVIPWNKWHVFLLFFHSCLNFANGCDWSQKDSGTRVRDTQTQAAFDSAGRDLPAIGQERQRASLEWL